MLLSNIGDPQDRNASHDQLARGGGIGRSQPWLSLTRLLAVCSIPLQVSSGKATRSRRSSERLDCHHTGRSSPKICGTEVNWWFRLPTMQVTIVASAFSRTYCALHGQIHTLSAGAIPGPVCVASAPPVSVESQTACSFLEARESSGPAALPALIPFPAQGLILRGDII